MILFRIIQHWKVDDGGCCANIYSQDRGLYITAEGALRVMKQLKADNPDDGWYTVEVIETDDEEEVKE